MSGIFHVDGFEYGPNEFNYNVAGWDTGEPDEIDLETNVTIQDDVVRSGRYALKCAPTDALPSAIAIAHTFSHHSGSARVYFMFGTLPASGRVEVLMFMWSGQNEAATFVYYDSTDGRLHLRQTVDEPDSGYQFPLDYTSGPESDGPPIEAGRWYRLDIRVTGWGAEGGQPEVSVDWQVDGTAYPSITADPEGMEGDFPFNLLLGSSSTEACTIYFDDLVLSGQPHDADPPDPDPTYPIGPGYVLPYLPSACGTHNDPSDRLQDADGSAIDSNSWQGLDDWPFNPPASWDGVKQITTDASAYAEFLFEDITEAWPLSAFHFWFVAHGIVGAGTGSGNIVFRVIYDGASYSESTSESASSSAFVDEEPSFSSGDTIKAEQVDISAAKFNAVVVRVGFSSDAIPDIAADAMMFQAAFSTEDATFAGGVNPGLEKATLAHVIVAEDGASCYPVVGTFEAEELSSLGQIGGGGTVARSFFEAHRDVINQGSEWWTYIRETGEVRFWMRMFEPSVGKGPVEIRGEGAAGLLEALAGRFFYAGYGTGYWVTQEIQERAKAPKSAPSLALGAAGNVNVGVHRYKVTFITADGETRPGPRSEIDVTGGAKQVSVTGIPTGHGFVTGRRIYRTQAGGTTYGLLTTINDNTTTSYTDNTADGGLGVAPPDSFDAPEIEVNIDKGAITFHVSRGSNVADDQRAAALFPLPGDEPISGIELDLDRDRDTTGYVLKVQKADDEESAFSTVETISLDDDGEQRPFIEVSGGPEVLRLLFEKVGTCTDCDPFTLKISLIKVFGRANDPDFTTSDVIADVLGEAGVSDEFVQESGLQAMPADFLSSNAGEVAEFEAIMTGWPLILRKEGLKTIGEFHDYGEKLWRLVQPESIDELESLPPYNHVRAVVREEEGEVVKTYEVLDEDAEDTDRLTLEVALPNPGTGRLVKHFVDSLARIAFRRRFVGTIACTQLLDDNGVKWHTLYAHAGDALWHPGAEVRMAIDGIRINESLPVLVFADPIVAQIERFNRRQERKLALRAR